MPKPVLPVLCSTHPHRVASDLPIKKVLQLLDGSFPDHELGWKSENEKTAAELVVEMIDYYRHFDVYRTVIKIERGMSFKR